MTRRHFISLTGSAAGLLLPACQTNPIRPSQSAHVIIIGGGFGGATAAKYIRRLSPSTRITLIEPNITYTRCPGSNWVLGGFKQVDSLSLTYQTLSSQYDIKLIHQKVSSIDPDKHTITTEHQQTLRYDRLIVAPGIDFKWDTIEGLDESTADLIPHAWKAGHQTAILNNQIKAMRNGGTVIICAPPNPYKCPPGPYERASMMAYYFKQYKPKSKIIILDAKSQFSKQRLFIEGWKRHYGFGTANSMIEWVSIPDNPITRIDAKNKTIETVFGDHYKADVLNYIPAQKSANIAEQSGLCDATGWCPVAHNSSESLIHSDIHVIGDAANYNPLPKSAFAANSEAKVCAFAVVSLLNEQEIIQPTWVNTCYSLITQDQAISVSMVYKLNNQGLAYKVNGAGGVTKETNQKSLSLEADQAYQWFNSISTDSFG